jgi:putative ABC transport system substrate-binding protein
VPVIRTEVPVRRIGLAVILLLNLPVGLVTGEAQREAKPARIGFLVTARNLGIESAFPQGMAELGYVEGRDIIIEWRAAAGRTDHLPALAEELVQLRVDVIVAAGPEARLAAMKATSTLPIITVGGRDPVAEGWAASLARPGGNVSGLTVTYPEMLGKNLELLKELVRGLSRAAALWDPTALGPETLVETMRAARALGVDLRAIEVRSPGDLDGAVREAAQDRRQALVVFETPMLFAQRAHLAQLARRHRLAAIGEWRLSASAGYLVSYGADLGDLLRRAASYVDKILKGAKPGALPIQRPTKFEFVINLKTAKSLGLTIPPSILGRADQVIDP